MGVGGIWDVKGCLNSTMGRYWEGGVDLWTRRSTREGDCVAGETCGESFRRGLRLRAEPFEAQGKQAPPLPEGRVIDGKRVGG